MLKTLLKASFLFILIGVIFHQTTHQTLAADFNIPCTGDNAANVQALIDAINTANGNGVADTINLATDCTYTLTAVDNHVQFREPNGLPVINTEITIYGNGSTIERDTTAAVFRIFELNSGQNSILNLHDITLKNGISDYGGLLNVAGQLNVYDSTLSGGTAYTQGGGIHNGGVGVVTVINSTVMNNVAPLGAGILDNLDLTVIGSTFTNNVADTADAIWACCDFDISDTTISGNGTANSVCAVQSVASQNTTMSNTIIADNAGGELCGGFNSQSYSLVGDNIDPGLLPLGNYGGPTQTFALREDSPALDAGNCTADFDQRGEPRRIDFVSVANAGNSCDIGAYELQSPAAMPDSYATEYAKPLSVPAPGVLVNDIDANNVVLTPTVVENPANGTVLLNNDGSFTYTPNINFRDATDSFTYKVSNGTNESQPTTVSIAVGKDFNIACGDVNALINAINVSNANNFDDTINLASNCTYTLASINNNSGGNNPNGLPVITGTIILNGNGSHIERSTSANTPNFRIIEVNPGDLTVNNLVVSHGQNSNGGSGISVHNGTLQIYDSQITDNHTSNAAGGIRVTDGELVLSRTLVSENSSQMQGGGIYGVNSIVNISNSTIFQNTSNDANTGGGIQVVGQSSLTIADSTIVGNSSTLGAGGGIRFEAATGMSISNTIVSNNSAVTSGDIQGAFVSGGHNILGAVSGTITGTTSSNLIDVDPLLGPLQNNGGNTLTIALLPASPAIDAGNCTGTDQRGLPRPHDFTGISNAGNGCDIGAYEAQNLAPIVLNDSYTTTRDVPVSVGAPGVLQNDLEPDLVQMNTTLISDVSNGTLQFSNNGSFVYTPDELFTGVDTFSYSTSANPAYSSIGIVTITVNDSPVVANADTYSTLPNTTITIAAPGVLSNDSDLNNEPLTAILVSDPSNGVLTLNSNGAFSYAPATNFIGTDSFTYIANNGLSNSDETTVSINVGNTPTSLIPPTNLLTNGAAIKPTYNWSHITSPNALAVPDLYYNIIVISNDEVLNEWYLSLEICNGTDCSVTPDFELADGNYTWYVRSASTTIISTRSQDATFEVDTDGIPAPSVIQKITPIAEAEIASSSVRFEWTPDSNATYYRLRINSPSGLNFEQWFEASLICTGSICFTNRELPPGVYEWSIVGWGPGGMGSLGSPQTANSLFYAGIRPPSAITPTYPTNASSLTATKGIELQWPSTENALWYRVVVLGNDNYLYDEWFEGVEVCDDTLCTASSPLWLTNGTYIWYVAGWNEDGMGAWNNGSTFAINSPAPDVIQRVSPTEGVTTTYVPFIWQADPNASWYRLYVLEGEGYVFDQWINASEVCTSEVCTYDDAIIPNGNYQWWLVGWGPGGMGEWDFEALTFSLNISAPDQVNALAMTSTAQASEVSFHWNTTTNGLWYHIVIEQGENTVHDMWYSGNDICMETVCGSKVELTTGAYTWKVQAWGPGGVGIFNTPVTFTVQ